ncbi:transmembrane and ubiquitin-like domain-containing protein 1 [Aplochiton taeniatus]
MALIEGVGDEVTLLFGAALLLLVLVLAWASTHTAEPPDHLFTTPPASVSTSSSASASLQLQTPPLAQRPAPGHGTAGEGSDPPPAPATLDALSAAPGEDGKAEPRAEAGSREGDGGGGPADAEDTRNMVLRLKFLNDTERTAQVKPEDTIGYIKRTYFAGQEHQVRLIYQGQLLQDDGQTLASLHLADNCVLHCHISQHATREAPAGVRAADQAHAVALNVGSLMVPLLMLMLSVLWYFQIQYRQFFTAPATASLVGITIFFSFVAFGVYRR